MDKYFFRNCKPLEFISEEQADSIRDAIMDVLANTGVRVEHERARALFADNGCRVDTSNNRVYIPTPLVEKCLASCPKNDMENLVAFMQNVGNLYVDLDTWETRPATLEEHGEAMRVVDALDTCVAMIPWEFYMQMQGIPDCMAPLEGLASAFRNSGKIQSVGYAQDWEIFGIKMFQAMGEVPTGSMSISSPLTLYSECCDAAFRVLEAGGSLSIGSGTSMGASGPATVVGSTITNSAEIMAGLVLAQLIAPGSGVTISTFALPMDMHTGEPIFGSVGSSIHCAVSNQVWRKWKLPLSSWHTGFSNSKKIDFQSGYERSMTALLAALTGANYLCIHGSLYGELTYNPVLSVLDDDLANWIGRVISGVEVTPDTMALDLIKEVGPIPGQFLTTKHTRQHWRDDNIIPECADITSYPTWLANGKKDALELAKERTAHILATHKPRQLTEEQDLALSEILEEARCFYRQKGMM